MLFMDRIKGMEIRFDYDPEEITYEIEECMQRFGGCDYGEDCTESGDGIDLDERNLEVLSNREGTLYGYYELDDCYVTIEGVFENKNGDYDPDKIMAKVTVNPL